eukprot:TRINITY_DN6000_c0_g1_i2.p1 TRINITY_DN6000_c0_g1~~TRINITY_DN6000_c0_g1_i2.p1  ORF type:complete len:103 (+),score=35.20 TRINITY_DN6000_c0_g1_i2:39-311(+)
MARATHNAPQMTDGDATGTVVLPHERPMKKKRLHPFVESQHHPTVEAMQHISSPLSAALLIFAVHKTWQIPAIISSFRAFVLRTRFRVPL